ALIQSGSASVQIVGRPAAGSVQARGGGARGGTSRVRAGSSGTFTSTGTSTISVRTAGELRQDANRDRLTAPASSCRILCIQPPKFTGAGGEVALELVGTGLGVSDGVDTGRKGHKVEV